MGAALALLVLAAFLMREPATERVTARELAFPRHPRDHEIERQMRRSTLVLPPPSSAAAPLAPTAHEAPAEQSAPVATQDPLHVALADQDVALVLEAAAVKDSPLGRMLLACLSPRHHEHLVELERRIGLRPLEQVDRVALGMEGDESQPVLMLHGDFTGFDPSGLELETPLSAYGARGLAALGASTGFAVWGRELLIVGAPEGVRSTLARLEGEKPALEQAAASEAYGDVYGTISGRAASRLIPSELRDRLGATAERITLHVDASDDLLLVAQVYGSDAERLRDLASSVGGALALARLNAARKDEPVLFDLLEQSRVIPDHGSFQIEMALPLDTLREQLGECAHPNAP